MLRRIVATTTLVSALAVPAANQSHAQDIPYVTGAWTKEIGNVQAVVNEGAALIQRYGWKCDSVDSVRRMLFKTGFVYYCNGFRYSYDVWDRGGRWVVKIND
ncbi:hypothetical protein F1188_04335 [Roseospira marina]|uniref:PepSY domain-containing protein n=1 Tax=Roseospira marina TaxID=140057 RepID=A0A5M6IHM3_9PROT|nr:hypothetical protein [Roseospira marina]KAA5607135.1 hypothetical protein F1188_04335 [Roseospira marina]MBB4312665.1 hypothetical protein [Roseospira marina]MBB5086562.1 hypothetical protein [Roseospira marina]